MIKSIPIGSPIANTQVYILDQYGKIVPKGIPGELYISGDGLARGYLNRPELTKERFVPNPFNPGTLMYKSGDLARWLEGGNLEYLGRIDTQVKVRGFRIEVGEIEVQLNQHPAIKNSAIVVQGTDVNKQLVAFYLANDTTPNNVVALLNDDLNSHLKEVLPEYMIPSAYMSLVSIPLTPNGKVDRRALENVSVNLESSQAYIAPRNDTEKDLVDIWAKILQIPEDSIGVNDSFFELGGHSLLATQLISEIRSQLEIDLPLKSLFDVNTLAGNAALINAFKDQQRHESNTLDALNDEFEEVTL